MELKKISINIKKLGHGHVQKVVVEETDLKCSIDKNQLIMKSKTLKALIIASIV